MGGVRSSTDRTSEPVPDARSAENVPAENSTARTVRASSTEAPMIAFHGDRFLWGAEVKWIFGAGCGAATGGRAVGVLIDRVAGGALAGPVSVVHRLPSHQRLVDGSSGFG